MIVRQRWERAAILISRLILAGLFLMAASFKLLDLEATAGLIRSKGFPAAWLLALGAAGFELSVAASLATGRWLRPAALLGVAYVLSLGFLYHGPSAWAANPLEFAIFTYHFVFVAALLLAAAGPDRGNAQ